MRTALAMLAAVLLLAGCGHAKDPFEGTWRYGESKFVFAKPAGHCTLELQNASWYPAVRFPLTRRGNDLFVTFLLGKGPPKVTEEYIFRYSPQSGRLFFIVRVTYVPSATMRLTRVSDSTAVPTVSATEPPD